MLLGQTSKLLFASRFPPELFLEYPDLPAEVTTIALLVPLPPGHFLSDLVYFFSPVTAKDSKPPTPPLKLSCPQLNLNVSALIDW